MNSIKIRDVLPGEVIKCSTLEEKEQLWLWFYRNGYVRDGSVFDTLDSFIKVSSGCYTIDEERHYWDASYSDTAIPFSELLLDRFQSADSHHQYGAEAAWEAAKRLRFMAPSTRKNIFNRDSVDDIMMEFSAGEVMDMFESYDNQKSDTLHDNER